MKRYLLFAGDQYYPRGGWRDLVGDFDTIEEAVAVAKAGPSMIRKVGYDWFHVVDQEASAVVEEGWSE